MHTGTKPKKCERGSPEPLLQHLTLWSLGPPTRLFSTASVGSGSPVGRNPTLRARLFASYNKLGID